MMALTNIKSLALSGLGTRQCLAGAGDGRELGWGEKLHQPMPCLWCIRPRRSR